MQIRAPSARRYYGRGGLDYVANLNLNAGCVPARLYAARVCFREGSRIIIKSKETRFSPRSFQSPSLSLFLFPSFARQCEIAFASGVSLDDPSKDLHARCENESQLV